MVGCVGSETLIRRTHPHGQPKLGSVKVPYTSSVVRAKCVPGIGIAECPFGQVLKQLAGTAAGSSGVCSHTGRFAGLVSRSPCRSITEAGGLGAFTTELVSSMRNCPASMARKVVLPSAVGAMEWTNRLQS